MSKSVSATKDRGQDETTKEIAVAGTDAETKTLGKEAIANESKDATDIDKRSSDASKLMEAFTVSKTLPMVLFPTILSFCPKATLLKMRTINKTFCDCFALKEYHERFVREGKTKEKFDDDDDGDRRWGETKDGSINKALSLAKAVFYRHQEASSDNGENDGGSERPPPVLLAEGYNEAIAKELLEKGGIAFGLSEGDDQGAAKFWRVEARFCEVSLAEAIRQLKITLNACMHTRGFSMDPFIFMLLTAPSNKKVRISECEVSIRKRNGGACETKSIQLFSFLRGKEEFPGFIISPTHFWTVGSHVTHFPLGD
ncbi:MAG: hypothetical protein SGILL_007791 [Bacillariaceae sp.]